MKWFSPVRGSIKGKINKKELNRVILTAISVGLISSILDFLQHKITNSPQTYSITVMFIVAVFDFTRRKYIHGR